MQAVFYDGHTATAHKVEVVLDRHHAKIIANENTTTPQHWLLEEITIIQKPKDKLPAIFSYRDEPDAQLVFDSHLHYLTLLAALPARERYGIQWRLPLGILAVFCGLVFLTLVGIPRAAENLVPLIPRAYDAKLGQQALSSFTEDQSLCDAPEAVAMLEKIVSQLSEETETGATYPITIVKSPVENAMILPGGFIILYSGLLNNADSIDEIAGILAHEMGHEHYRHGMQRLLHVSGMSLLIDSFTGGAGIAYAAMFISQLDYSRDQERAADRFALELMQEKGFNPAALRNFFQRQKDKFSLKAWQNELLGYFSTHPTSDERLEAIDAFISKQPPPMPAMHVSAEDWNTISRACVGESN